ncbi:hypothetical protein JG687_00009727 [Phytophthora cactorum]|uniref:BART domain-containing protein n=1 Tax=Phytophthora cactorum TaxID=29920 RepID=A0A8T1U935_9STRA|nr:hypothetical protein JG687_00009727 [Phytophthora cactorum]
MDEVLLAVESSDPVVARLVAFCDQGLSCLVDKEHMLLLSMGQRRMKNTIMKCMNYSSYEKVFEDVIATFLSQEQLTPDEFFAHCRALQRSPKHEDATGNLQLLLSALDFEAFCELMTQEAIQTQIALKEAEDMGL